MDIEEARIVEVYTHLSVTNSVIIDIGVNRGFHSDRMTKLCPDGHIFGVEANPLHVKYLKERYSKNENYTLIPYAVIPSNKNIDYVTFKVSEKFHGRGGIKGLHIWENIDSSIKFEEIKVGVINFDKLIEKAGNNLHFIKMDIEGPEYSILYNTSTIGEMDIHPVIALENSVHGLDIAEITFDQFKEKIDGINYQLISTKGEVVNSDIDRKKSGQTIFLSPNNLARKVSVIISSFNKNNEEIN